MEGDLLSAVFMTILSVFQSTPSAWRETGLCGRLLRRLSISIHSLRMEGDDAESQVFSRIFSFQSTPSAWRETRFRQIQLPPQCHFNPLPPHGGRREKTWQHTEQRNYFNPLPPHGGRLYQVLVLFCRQFHFNPLPPHGGRRASLMIIDDLIKFQSTPSAWRETSVHNWLERLLHISIHSLRMEGDTPFYGFILPPGHISIHSLRMEGDSKTAQESVFHFAYPCTILQKRMQKTTFCTRKNGFFRKKGEKFGAKPSASFCAPMIRTDTFPLNFSHRISGSSMSMVSFAPICSTFD